MRASRARGSSGGPGARRGLRWTAPSAPGSRGARYSTSKSSRIPTNPIPGSTSRSSMAIGRSAGGACRSASGCASTFPTASSATRSRCAWSTPAAAASCCRSLNPATTSHTASTTSACMRRPGTNTTLRCGVACPERTRSCASSARRRASRPRPIPGNISYVAQYGPFESPSGGKYQTFCWIQTARRPVCLRRDGRRPPTLAAGWSG